MFEKRNISEEEALKRACKQNGYQFVPNNNKPRKTITLVNDGGKETVVDNKFNVVKPEDTVRIQGVTKFSKAAVATFIETDDAGRLVGSVALKPIIAGHSRLGGVKKNNHVASLTDTKVARKGKGTAMVKSQTAKHGISRSHKGATHIAEQ